MDIETAKVIFSNDRHRVAAQNDIRGPYEWMSKGHYHMDTLEFIDACQPHEVMSISEANQLLDKFCLPVGKGPFEDILYWHYYPHKPA